MRVVDHDTCAEKNDNIFNLKVDEKTILCAGGQDSSGCQVNSNSIMNLRSQSIVQSFKVFQLTEKFALQRISVEKTKYAIHCMAIFPVDGNRSDHIKDIIRIRK